MRAVDLAGAPPLDVAIDPLLAAMAGRILVVHVAAIERGFLRPALRRQGVRLRGPMIDTSVLGLIWLHERDGARPAPHLARASSPPRSACPPTTRTTRSATR